MALESHVAIRIFIGCTWSFSKEYTTTKKKKSSIAEIRLSNVYHHVYSKSDVSCRNPPLLFRFKHIKSISG